MEVKQVVNQTFDSTYWVSADISDFHEDNMRGHCYLELVEKNDSKLIEAKIRASIWANTYKRLKPFFKQQTGQDLRTGMKILAEVSVTFHELYGMSCVIQNIDPTYTLGDIARKKQETIQRLKEDGVWDMNKQVGMPELVQRIAVISSASAAGYGDFCNQLQMNERGFYFSFQLFPAIMQGENAAQSVIEALDRVFEEREKFDVVVIIRGGGATTDLLAFDEYDLAYVVAQFPLPVITGIGHERDESVTDMVAHTRCKTPTAVAAHVYEMMLEVESVLLNIEEGIKQGLTLLLEEEQRKLNDMTDSLIQACTYRINMEQQSIQLMQNNLNNAFRNSLNKESHKIDLMENTLRHISPENILKKGYSITVSNGKVIKNAKELKAGDSLRTIFASGEVESVVSSK